MHTFEQNTPKPYVPLYDFRCIFSQLPNTQALRELEKTWSTCIRCSMRATSNSPVILGEGPANAKVLVVGEAPGAVEMVRRRPFVGPVGKLLRATLLKDIEHLVFITNVLACRPPQNRNPTNTEAQACYPRLESIINILQPRLIVFLGLVAAKYGEMDGIERNKICNWPPQPKIRAIHMYHPSYVLRQSNSSRKYNSELVAPYMNLRARILFEHERNKERNTE